METKQIKDRRGRVQKELQWNNEYVKCKCCGGNDLKVIYYPDSGLPQDRQCMSCNHTW